MKEQMINKLNQIIDLQLEESFSAYQGVGLFDGMPKQLVNTFWTNIECKSRKHINARIDRWLDMLHDGVLNDMNDMSSGHSDYAGLDKEEKRALLLKRMQFKHAYKIRTEVVDIVMDCSDLEFITLGEEMGKLGLEELLDTNELTD